MRGNYALDGGAIVSLLTDEPESRPLLDAIVETEGNIVSHELALTEAYYILCRKQGREAAKQKIEDLVESRYIYFEQTATLSEDAALLKCRRSISLPDCFTIVQARKWGGAALFRAAESELVRAMNDEPFEVEIVFIRDLGQD